LIFNIDKRQFNLALARRVCLFASFLFQNCFYFVVDKCFPFVFHLKQNFIPKNQNSMVLNMGVRQYFWPQALSTPQSIPSLASTSTSPAHVDPSATTTTPFSVNSLISNMNPYFAAVAAAAAANNTRMLQTNQNHHQQLNQKRPMLHASHLRTVVNNPMSNEIQCPPLLIKSTESSDQNPIRDTASLSPRSQLITPKIDLDGKDLWQEFHKYGTEMVITKSGR
jgi:hypothetical protein